MLPLRTERLVLRPFEDADLDAFVVYRADPEVARLQSWQNFTRSDGEVFLAKNRQATLGEGWYQVAVGLDGVLVGDVALYGRSATAVELGFTFSRAVWGQGLATEAVGALIDALCARGVTRFESTTDARNLAAQRLLSRLGFEVEQVVPTTFKGAPCEEWVYGRGVRC